MPIVETLGAYLTRTGPTGRLLADDAWSSRHRGLLTVLWLHVPGLFVFAVARGLDLLHGLVDVAIVACCALAATALSKLGRGRRLRAAVVALGLLTASALVVHLSGGLIEAHFHFFVIMALLLLYEDWLVFLLAISYVGVHHGILGSLAPGSVYNHPDAVAHPVRWALIHAAFVAAASVANITAWRLNEDVRAEAGRARDRAEENDQLLRELKEAETSLRQTEKRYRSLVEQLPLAVYVDNRDDRSSNVYTSPQVEDMLGYPAEQWTDDPDMFIKALHPDDRERVLAEVAAAHESHTGFSSEYRLIARDGRVVWVRDQSVVVRDEHGRGEFGQGYLLDITVEKAREEQARSSQKMEAVGQLAGGVAHDFNNLLTVIQGYCSLALDRASSGANVEDEIEQVRRAAVSAATLTAQLLAFSRRENFQTESVEADVLIGEIEALLRRVIGEHIRLETRLGASGAIVEIDRGGLQQILVNLVVNARDAVGKRGRIAIATEVAERDGQTSLRLEVSDDGCGIDAGTQARIFEPFFTTKSVGEGTGLGLSTVYAIVQRSGGTVSVTSAPGAGTTILVSLPCHAAVQEDAAADEVALPGRGSETILLVEDEHVVRNLVREVLEHHGYAVEAPETATDALALAGSGLEFDLLLTDVVMPDMNGWELAAVLRATRPTLPVVYVSGYADDVIPPNAFRAEERFLQKPFELSALAAAVREAFDESRSATRAAA
jgi:PAS domain S-box-containing protein